MKKTPFLEFKMPFPKALRLWLWRSLPFPWQLCFRCFLLSLPCQRRGEDAF